MSQQEETRAKRPPVGFMEAGAMLGVSRWTIYKMVERGDLRAIVISGRKKIRLAEIDHYIERQQRAADRGNT